MAPIDHSEPTIVVIAIVSVAAMMTLIYAIFSSIFTLCKDCCRNLVSRKDGKKWSSVLKWRKSASSKKVDTPAKVAYPSFGIPKSYQGTLIQPSSANSSFSELYQGNDSGSFITPSRHAKVETPYGKLDPDIYKPARLSVVAGAGQSEKVGILHALALYDPLKHELQVTLLSAKDLMCRDPVSGYLDTSVTICLLPDRKSKKQTKVVKKSLSPQYYETFTFAIEPDEDVHARLLILQLFYHDYFSRAHLLGEASVPLVEYDFTSHQISLWCNLRDTHSLMQSFYNMTHAEMGDLMFSVHYNRSKEILTVNIIKAINLSTGKLMSSVVYGKVSLYLDGRRLFKKKSRVKDIHNKNTIIFNEPLTFSIDRSTLLQSSLRVSLNNYNLVGASVLLGEVELSGDSRGPEMIHWETMLKDTSSVVTMWHPLRRFKLAGRDLLQSEAGSEGE